MMDENSGALLRFVEAVFRNKLIVFVVAGTIFLSAFVYAVFAKRVYSSDMKILVQNTRPTPVISGDRSPQVSNGVSSDGMEAEINSEAVLLESNDLLEGLARFRAGALHNEHPPALGSLQMTQQVADLQRRITVLPMRKTNLLDVTFKDPNAKDAQLSLEWLSTAFLDKHAQLRRPAGTYHFFDTQTKQYEDQLRDAENKLVEFQRSNDLVSLTQEKAMKLDNLNRVLQQLGESQANLKESQRKVASLSTQLSSIDHRVTTQVRDTPNQYSAERLNTLLVDLRNKKTQLSTRFQPTDPLVKELDDQISATEQALTIANGHTLQETTSDNNPVSTTLEQSFHTTSVEASGTRARIKILSDQAAAYTARLDQLQQLSVQNDLMERSVQEIKQNRDLYAQKRDEAAIDDALDKSKIADVSIAQEPTLSWQAVQPHRLLTVILGSLVACFAALACVLVLDTLRENFYASSELESSLSCPILATVPENPRLPPLPRQQIDSQSGTNISAIAAVR